MSRLHRLAFLCAALACATVAIAIIAGRATAQEPSEGPIVICVMGLRAKQKSHHDQMMLAVKQVAAKWNSNGTVKGRKIVVVDGLCTNKLASIRTVVNGLKKSAGTNVLIAPLEASVAASTHRVALGKLACISINHKPATIVARLGHYLNDLYCARRIAIGHDRRGKDLAKAMQKDIPYPAELVLSFDLAIKPKKLEKQLLGAEHAAGIEQAPAV